MLPGMVEPAASLSSPRLYSVTIRGPRPSVHRIHSTNSGSVSMGSTLFTACGVVCDAVPSPIRYVSSPRKSASPASGMNAPPTPALPSRYWNAPAIIPNGMSGRSALAIALAARHAPRNAAPVG
jgi:hypothetical protein